MEESFELLENENFMKEKFSFAPFDWGISDKHNAICLIIAVSALEGIKYRCNGILYNSKLKHIFPLPLSREFLEKNGWELHDDVFINKDKNISSIIFSTSGNFILGGVFVIEYVHQLQQYLRLNGDIEFANNLKV